MPETDQEYIQNLRRIYNDFDVRDMSWEDFLKKMLAMRDPDKIEKDLANIKARKARQRVNSRKIRRILEN